jgi:hypothetical protein
VGKPSASELGLTARDWDHPSACARPLQPGDRQGALVAGQTVKFHLTNNYRKLDAANRTEAVRLAYQRGIIDNPLYDG